MKLKVATYNVIFKPEPEGGYTVIVPSLRGCVTYGKTLTEAKEMVEDAIKGFIESLKKHHEPIPTDEESFITMVSVPQDNKTTVYA